MRVRLNRRNVRTLHGVARPATVRIRRLPKRRAALDVALTLSDSTQLHGRRVYRVCQ